MTTGPRPFGRGLLHTAFRGLSSPWADFFASRRKIVEFAKKIRRKMPGRPGLCRKSTVQGCTSLWKFVWKLWKSWGARVFQNQECRMQEGGVGFRFFHSWCFCQSRREMLKNGPAAESGSAAGPVLCQRRRVFSPLTVDRELSVAKYCARMPAASSARLPPASPPSATRHRAIWGLS